MRAAFPAADAPVPTPPSASPPTPAGDGERPSSSVAVPRKLPATLISPPPPASRSRGARRGPAAGSGGRRQVVAPASASASVRNATDRLAEAVRVVGRDVDPGVTGADILEVAMAKGPMFEWLSYWPEQGYPKEDHPY
jgi:hypothetical protein